MILTKTEEILERISQQVDSICKKLDEMMMNFELEQKKYLNMDEFAKLAGIPKATAYQISSKNLLPKFRIGKRVLFKKDDVNKYIEMHRISSQEEVEEIAVTSFMKEVQHG